MATRSHSKPSQEKARGGSRRHRTAPAGRKRGYRVAGLVMLLVAAVFFIERWTRPAAEPAAGVAGPAAEPRGIRPECWPTSVSAAEAAEQLIEEGRRIADQLVEAFPQDAQALALAGQIHFTLGNATAAVSWWEQCIAFDPACGEAWSGLAEAHWERGDFERAADCMQRIQTSHPQLAAERIYVLVDSLMNLGRENEAIASLGTSARAGALAAPGRVVLGQAYLQAEDYASAQREFTAAVAAAPRLAAAHYGLAEALAQQGQTAEAQDHRDEYARLKQQDLAAWDRMRGAGRGLEKVDPAEVRGLVSDFRLRAGSLYAARGRPFEATDQGERALRSESADGEAGRLLKSLPAGPGQVVP